MCFSSRNARDEVNVFVRRNIAAVVTSGVPGERSFEKRDSFTHARARSFMIHSDFNFDSMLGKASNKPEQRRGQFFIISVGPPL